MSDELINPFTDLAAVESAASLDVDTASESAASQSGGEEAGLFSSLQVGSGSIAFYVNRQGMWLGGASYDSATFKSDMQGNVTAGSFTATNPILNNAQINSVASGTDISIQGWSSTIAFSASDYRTVAWAAGTVILTDGSSYSIDAGNTGAISATTYIYFDKSVSTTALQTTLTASTAVGTNKILIAVAVPNTDTTSKATFQAFGGRGGNSLMVDNIVANSASTNEFISNTAQIKDAVITSAKISSLSVDKLSSGTLISKTITLSFSEGAGDCYIACGKTDFDHDEAGFIMGIDDSDSNKVKFIIGTTSEYLMISGDTLTNTLRISPYTASVGGQTLLSSTIQRYTASTSWELVKELTVGRRGDYKILWEVLTNITNDKLAYGDLRVNGVSVGGIATKVNYSTTTTVSSLKPGDVIALYCKVETGADSTCGGRYFNLKVDITDEVYAPYYTSGKD